MIPKLCEKNAIKNLSEFTKLNDYAIDKPTKIEPIRQPYIKRTNTPILMKSNACVGR